MRRGVKFVDSLGWAWDVHEVRANERRQATDVPPSGDETKGTLYFFSRYVTKKLSEYPRAWRSASHGELERLCRLARALGTALLSEETSPTARASEPRVRESAAGEAPAGG